MIPEDPAVLPPQVDRRGLRLTSLRPLRRRKFAVLWAAALVSNIGSWVQTVAVGVLVTELTGQARWTGLVAAAAFLPVGLVSPVGGALADRVDRRRLLIVTTLGETAFAALLAALAASGQVTPANVTLTVLGMGCMAALGYPAYQAILPDLVPPEELLAATSLSMAQYNLGRVLGPALAGLVLALGSYTFAFVLNAISFGAVLVAVTLIRLPPRVPDDDGGGLWPRIVAGARGAWAEPGCRLAILGIAAAGLFLSPFIALIPAVAIKVLGEGEGATSVLITAQGVGAVGGALALPGLAHRFGRRRVLLADLIVLPVLLAAYGLSPSLPVATVAITAVGAAYVGILSGLGTVVQLRAPPALRGRILSLYFVALGIVYPIAAVLQGALGDRFGLRTVTAGAALAFVVLVVAVRASRPDLTAALDDPPETRHGPGAGPGP